MKTKMIAAFLLVIFLASCSGQPKNTDEMTQIQWIDIYYEDIDGKEALIGSEPCAISSEGGVGVMLRTALEQMSVKPVRNDLRSPLPPNTKVQEVRFQSNHLIIDFSQEYAALSGVQKSIADACVTMTALNFWNVDSVTITANGKIVTEQLGLKDVIQTAPRVFSGEESVSVYLKNRENGNLSPVKVNVLLQEGVVPERVAMERLIAGEEGSELVSPLPDGSELLSIHTDADICYVNFSSAILNIPAENRQEEEYRIVKSVVLTLTSIDYIERVQILIDGAEVQGFESLDLRQEYSEKNFTQP